MIVGDVARMTHWTHNGPGIQLTYRATKNTVACFLLLGHEAKDGTQPLDLEAALNTLGWVRK